VNGYDSRVLGMSEEEWNAHKNCNFYGKACDLKTRHGGDANQVTEYEAPDMPFAIKMHLNRK
jgi:hypothetical protein